MNYIQKLWKVRIYDVIVARGSVTKLIAEDSELASRTIFIEEDSTRDAPRNTLLSHGGVVAPMSPEVFSKLVVRMSHQLSFLPPMLLRPSVSEARASRRGKTLCYLGSFMNEKYLTEEILDGFAAVHEEHPDSRFIVAGDIFVGYKTKDKEALLNRFKSESGIEYKGHLSPEECTDIYINVCDFGVCGYSLDRNVLSTKVRSFS